MKITGKAKTILEHPVHLKFFITHYLAFCIPIMIASGIMYFFLRGSVVDRLETSYTNKLQNVKNTVEQSFNHYNNLAVQMSSVPWIKRLHEDNIIALDLERIDPVALNSYMRELVTYKSVNNLIKNLAVHIKPKEYVISDDGVKSSDVFFEEVFISTGMSCPTGSV